MQCVKPSTHFFQLLMCYIIMVWSKKIIYYYIILVDSGIGKNRKMPDDLIDPISTVLYNIQSYIDITNHINLIILIIHQGLFFP